MIHRGYKLRGAGTPSDLSTTPVEIETPPNLSSVRRKTLHVHFEWESHVEPVTSLTPLVFTSSRPPNNRISVCIVGEWTRYNTVYYRSSKHEQFLNKLPTDHAAKV